MSPSFSLTIARALVLAAFAAASWPALAGDLKAPLDLESTAVLPAGRGNPRFKQVLMWVDQKYNGLGQSEPLGRKLNKTVSWNEVVRSQKDPIDQNQLRG